MKTTDQKVALITGGAKGIGRAIALDLAAHHWWVAICYRTSAKEAKDVIDIVQQKGGEGLPIQCDVSDPQAAAGLVERVHQEWNRIDALINSAGPYHRVSLLHETLEGWHSMFDNNLHPVFYLTPAHYLSKVGLLALSRSFAKLIAADGITMNCVSPGFIDSGSAPKEELERMVKFIPAGYVGTVDDAVSAVRFLLSEEARYVNGANLQLSGAWGV